MAKGNSKKNQSSSPTRSLLYGAVILLIALFALVLGVSPEELQNLLDEYLNPDGQETGDVIDVPPPSGEWYQLYFTQPINTTDQSRHTGSQLEGGLIAAIDSAQRTIDGALYELNAPDTTAAFLRALDRGVRLRFVFDNEHALERPDATVDQLIARGVEFVSDERSAFMHHKFLIIDELFVWTGSTNFTRNDIYNNNNNAMLIRSTQLARNYQAEFDEMFIDGSFTRTSVTRDPPHPDFSLDGTRIETFFAPDDGPEIEARLIELANNAQSSIRVMAFSFTLEPVGTAMVNAIGRGVNVQGLFENTGSFQGQMPPIACAGGDVRQDGNPQVMHHKVMIFDDQIVVMGSFNFSASARNNNSENLLIIHNPTIAAAFENEFQTRFAEGRLPDASRLAC